MTDVTEASEARETVTRCDVCDLLCLGVSDGLYRDRCLDPDR